MSFLSRLRSSQSEPAPPSRGSGSRLVRGLLFGTLAFLSGDQSQPQSSVPAPVRCVSTAVHEQLSLAAFTSQPLVTAQRVQWPNAVEHPFRSLRPTFDDGPHPNDRALVETLRQFPFETPIFYYNGINFFSPAVLAQWGIDRTGDSSMVILPGGWRAFIDAQRQDQPFETYLLSVLNPAMVDAARAVSGAGYTIGFHGMFHASEESQLHLQNFSQDAFAADLDFFEELVRVATGKKEYRVSSVRPPYGAGVADFLEKPFVRFCTERGITVRNWSFSSDDWTVSPVRSERMLAQILQVITAGKHPDVLYHSQHQDGTSSGNFGALLANWSGQILSLRVPERAAEIRGYKEILEAVLAGTSVTGGTRLVSAGFALGSPHQLAVDSSYNTELEVQYMGALQSQWNMLGHARGLSPTVADGYSGESTVQQVSALSPDHVGGKTHRDLAHVLQDPATFLTSPLADDVPFLFPSSEELCHSHTTFANRGLQVQAVAQDLLDHGGVDIAFLQSYRFHGLFIDPDRIPDYVQLYAFLRAQGLDAVTASRVTATALLETGVKNNLDRVGIGKGTVEATGGFSYDLFGDTEFLPQLVRKAGFAKQATVMQYGLGSIGMTQVPLHLIWPMFEVILERDLSRAEIEHILSTPEGAGFATYLYLHQNTVRVQSEEF